jgi:hypothetical protein
MPANIYYQAADLILQDLGATPSAASVNLLVAWMEQEYTADELAVTNNPLATSLQSQGAVGYCLLPNGLRSSEPCYDTLADGAAACAATLRNGLYDTLVQALQQGDAATFFSQSGLYELAIWAGGPGNPNYDYAQRVQATYSSLPPPPSWAVTQTGGTGVNPPPSPPPVIPPAPYSPPAWPWLLVLGAGLVAVGLALYPTIRRVRL